MTTDNRTNEPTEAQVEAAAKAIWERYGDRGMFQHAAEHMKNAFRKDARAALVAAQGAAPQAESSHTSSYINPSLPGMIRNLWKSDPSENSVRTALKLAGDLIQELIDLKAAPVLPSSLESPAQAFADWHESWWRNEPDTIQKANAQAAFFAGWDARGAVSVLPSSGVDEDALAEVIAKSRGFGNGWEQIPPLTRGAYREIARAVAERLKEQGR